MLSLSAAAADDAAPQRTSDGIVLQIYAEQIAISVDEREVVHRVIRRASHVRAGEELIYTVQFTNATDSRLRKPVIVKAVPRGVSYVAGSAVGPHARVSYSVDAGLSWGAPDELQVIGRDGEPRRAEAADYTHLRWELQHDLAPGATGYLRFRARLR